MTISPRCYGADVPDPEFAGRARLQEPVAPDEPEEADDVSLALIWRQLLDGSRTVIDQFFTGTRCGLVLKRGQSVGPKRRLLGRRLAILEALLSGSGQKQVAIDLLLSPSTIASNAKGALELLGARGLPSHVHPLLILAATSAATNDSCAAGRLVDAESRSSEIEIVTVDRPDARLVSNLPAAEWQVLCRLFEGLCHAEIAKHRGTSVRTVANQIAAVFRRMGVSGRGELIQRLFALQRNRSVSMNEASARELPGRACQPGRRKWPPLHR